MCMELNYRVAIKSLVNYSGHVCMQNAKKACWWRTSCTSFKKLAANELGRSSACHSHLLQLLCGKLIKKNLLCQKASSQLTCSHPIVEWYIGSLERVRGHHFLGYRIIPVVACNTGLRREEETEDRRRSNGGLKYSYYGQWCEWRMLEAPLLLYRRFSVHASPFSALSEQVKECAAREPHKPVLNDVVRTAL